MSNYRELLKQSIDMLIRPYSSKEESDKANVLIAKIQNELANKDHEPDAYMGCNGDVVSKSTHKAGSKRFTIPLYISPPQRKPLSDKLINNIADGIFELNSDYMQIRTFARDIEKSHGIGE